MAGGIGDTGSERILENGGVIDFRVVFCFTFFMIINDSLQNDVLGCHVVRFDARQHLLVADRGRHDCDFSLRIPVPALCAFLTSPGFVELRFDALSEHAVIESR